MAAGAGFGFAVLAGAGAGLGAGVAAAGLAAPPAGPEAETFDDSPPVAGIVFLAAAATGAEGCGTFAADLCSTAADFTVAAAAAGAFAGAGFAAVTAEDAAVAIFFSTSLCSGTTKFLIA